MTLENFREVADEATVHVRFTEECAQRILLRCRQQPRRVVPKGAWISAAACLVVMAVSAGMLIATTLENAAEQEAESRSRTVQLSMAALDSQPPDAPQHPRYPDEAPPVEVGDYNGTEFAPAQGENGLWGYVDKTGNWVILPEYTRAEPVDGISGQVLDGEGKEAIVILSGQGSSRPFQAAKLAA